MSMRRILSWLAAWALLLAAALRAAGEIPQEGGEEGGEMVGPSVPPTLPHDATLELPEWTSDDLRQAEHTEVPSNLGGGLWPKELWPLMPEPARLPPLSKAATVGASTSETDYTEPLPPGLHDVYFGALPPESIIDPQGFIDEVQQEEMGKFFEEFAGKQANISVRLLLVGSRQQLPTDAELQALTDRWFPQQHGIVVLYRMGRPKASACGFSKSLSAQFTAEQFTAVRDACVREAMLSASAEDQLARYGIKLAVRMNRLKAENTDSKPIKAAKLTPSFVQRWQLWIGGAVILCVGLLGGWLLRRRKPPSVPQMWLFPDQEMVTRLNAPHCGGTVALLKIK